MSELALRAREKTDSAAIADLMNLPGVRFGTLRVPFISPAFAENWGIGPDRKTILGVRSGTVIGLAMLMLGRERTAHAASMLIFVHDDHVGSGVGTALMEALLDIADHWLGLKRVALVVNADNERAIRLYRKFGFEVEGTLHGDVLRDGQFIDGLAMARLRFEGALSPITSGAGGR
jgi:putative acetyltransferase